MAALSTGIPFLDRFLGGYQPGDNVVWAAGAGTFHPAFLEAAIGQVRKAADTVVWVNSNYAPQNIVRKLGDLNLRCRVVHVDAFTNGKGRGDPFFRGFYGSEGSQGDVESVCLEDPSEPKAFGERISEIETRCGEGTTYVFDSLTGLSELWKGERPVQEFFTHHCPKLYELQTVAHWVLDRAAHPASFVANLRHITQVVIQLGNLEEGLCELKVLKAEDRPSRVLNEALRYRVSRDAIEFLDRIPSRDMRLGDRIRSYRLEKTLTQAELARKLAITPSALCQIENNQVQPSLSLFLDLAEALGRRLDELFPAGEWDPREAADDGWTVHKKRDQIVSRRGRSGGQAGLEDQPLLPEGAGRREILPHLIRLAPGASGGRGFFDHKGPEYGWVVKGVLRVFVDREEVVLRKGDSLYLEGRSVRGWRNPGSTPCEIFWGLL